MCPKISFLKVEIDDKISPYQGDLKDYFGINSNIGCSIGIKNKKNQSFELNYDLSDAVDFADILFGGSYRNSDLNTKGTVLTDYDGPIKTNETGIFTSVQKDILDGAISLNGALRYDKAQNYEGSFTPRVGALFNFAPRHNLRVSYQTAMRTPTMQDMYIGLDGGPAILMGSSPDSVERFFYEFPDYSGHFVTI